MAILIKRYANRKLYNTQTSRYITLKGISELLEAGDDVRVVDNETGEDITSVALSQILVDSERSNTRIPGSLLSQLIERGGDVLYGAIKRSVDDASDGIEEFQDRVRKIVKPGDKPSEEQSGDERPSDGRPKKERGRLGDWVAFSSPDFDRNVQSAVERVFKMLDLPRRSDVDALNENLERVAKAVEALERAYAEEAEGESGSES